MEKKRIKYKILLIIICFISFLSTTNAVSNPYGKYQTLYGITTVRCTWYAWEQAYKNAHVALPGWGNAQTWYNSAISAGYKVGQTAKPNSIVVFSSIDGYGHVGYVVSVSDNYMITNEGGIVTTENEGIINGMKRSIQSENIIGYIYLDEAPSNNYVNNNSNNSNNKNEKLSADNNLQDLKIDIEQFVFDSQVTEYFIEVENDLAIIHINAIASNKNATIYGTGAKALQEGENKFTILVVAQNGDEKEYHITICRQQNNKEASQDNTKIKKITKNFDFKKLIMLIMGSILFVILTITIYSKYKTLIVKKSKK